MVAKRARDGKGGKAYRRQSQSLRHRTRLQNFKCVWCGQPIDTTLPATDRMSFTSDHPNELQHGGSLIGQQLQPMHRACNAQKQHSAPSTEIWGPS